MLDLPIGYQFIIESCDLLLPPLARTGQTGAVRAVESEGVYIDKLTASTTDLVRGSPGSPTGSPLAVQ